MEAVLLALAAPVGYMLFLGMVVLADYLDDKQKAKLREEMLEYYRVKQQESFKRQWDAFYKSRRKNK